MLSTLDKENKKLKVKNPHLLIKILVSFIEHKELLNSIFWGRFVVVKEVRNADSNEKVIRNKIVYNQEEYNQTENKIIDNEEEDKEKKAEIKIETLPYAIKNNSIYFKVNNCTGKIGVKGLLFILLKYFEENKSQYKYDSLIKNYYKNFNKVLDIAEKNIDAKRDYLDGITSKFYFPSFLKRLNNQKKSLKNQLELYRKDWERPFSYYFNKNENFNYDGVRKIIRAIQILNDEKVDEVKGYNALLDGLVNYTGNGKDAAFELLKDTNVGSIIKNSDNLEVLYAGIKKQITAYIDKELNRIQQMEDPELKAFSRRIYNTTNITGTKGYNNGLKNTIKSCRALFGFNYQYLVEGNDKSLCQNREKELFEGLFNDLLRYQLKSSKAELKKLEKHKKGGKEEYQKPGDEFNYNIDILLTHILCEYLKKGTDQKKIDISASFKHRTKENNVLAINTVKDYNKQYVKNNIDLLDAYFKYFEHADEMKISDFSQYISKFRWQQRNVIEKIKKSEEDLCMKIGNSKLINLANKKAYLGFRELITGANIQEINEFFPEYFQDVNRKVLIDIRNYFFHKEILKLAEMKDDAHKPPCNFTYKKVNKIFGIKEKK